MATPTVAETISWKNTPQKVCKLIIEPRNCLTAKVKPNIIALAIKIFKREFEISSDFNFGNFHFLQGLLANLKMAGLDALGVSDYGFFDPSTLDHALESDFYSAF